MRRQHISRFTFDSGYHDSKNILAGDTSSFAEGSCNQLVLGEALTVPFKGYYSKGTGTGTQVLTQLGNTWGGHKLQSSASGSLVEDFSKTLYSIGAGYLSKEGVTMQAYASTPTTISIDAATEVDVNDNFTENTHGMSTGNQIRLTTNAATPITSTPQVAVDTTYFVINTGSNTFKLATSWANAQAGTAINVTVVGVGTMIFTKGVDMTASTQLKVASVQLSDYLYKHYDAAGIARPDAPTLEVPQTIGANYTGLIDGAISFKLGAIRDRNNTGDLTNINAQVRSVSSTTSAVVTPTRKTVKITFPTAESGQTHWAVFATKAGFGGTGIHYRVGYRTSSSTSATWYFGISEATVAAATNRTLEFDFRDGDLLPEEAWLFDYVPPQGTHFVRMENVGVVLGCYDGTVAAVSLPNFFESYHPRHLIYFPEPVTAVLHRQIDDFAYVACRNSIHTLQYVGYRGDDYPSCTVSTICPEVGIAYQQNWAVGAGMIVAWIEGAGLVKIGSDGEIDYSFGAEVANFTRSWAASATVISFDPTTRSFVCGNGTSSISFCVESGVWSAPAYLTDCAITGSWLSAINTRGELVVTINNGGTHTAYSYFNNTGTTRMPIASFTRWQSVARPANLYEIAISTKGTVSSEPVVIGVHQNLFKTFIRGCSLTSASATLTAPSGTFTSAWTGKHALVTGADIGGAGVHYLIVKLTYVSGTQVTMVNRSSGSSQTSGANASNVFVIVGEDFEALTPTSGVDQHIYSTYPMIVDCRSFAVSVWQPTDTSTGGVIAIDVFGTGSQTSEARV